MVDHSISDGGLAASAEPRWMLVDLMFHKSLKNNDFPTPNPPPPPPTNPSRSLSTKLSASQHRPTYRARPFGVARGLPHSPKALAVPGGLRLYAEGCLRLAPPLLVLHLLHDTSLQLSRDRGHLALVKGVPPAIPDTTPEKAYPKQVSCHCPVHNFRTRSEKCRR